MFQQKNCSAPELTPRLEEGIDRIKTIAGAIGQVQRDCGMKQPPQEYVEQFNFGLTEVRKRPIWAQRQKVRFPDFRFEKGGKWVNV